MQPAVAAHVSKNVIPAEAGIQSCVCLVCRKAGGPLSVAGLRVALSRYRATHFLLAQKKVSEENRPSACRWIA